LHHDESPVQYVKSLFKRVEEKRLENILFRGDPPGRPCNKEPSILFLSTLLNRLF
jgi:hypothetical protein